MSPTNPQQMRVLPTLLAVAAILATIGGCGTSKFRYAPVSGQVLLDGDPVPNARIVFMPVAAGTEKEAGPYSNGTTDAEGHYTLSTVAPRPRRGAVVGTHRVIVSTRKSHLDPENPDVEIIEAEELIPAPYYDYRNTPLTIEVSSEGTSEAHFRLEQ